MCTIVVRTQLNAEVSYHGHYRFSGTLDGFFTSLFKGGVRVVAGLIAKLFPNAARLTTPTDTVGIRGTDFDARLCGTDCAAT